MWRHLVYYFAYDSNLSHKQMLERCPDSKPRFKATLPNYKLIFTGWSRRWRGGVASIMRVRGEKIVGGVYEISGRDLKLLDKYEGYPTLVDKLNIKVFLTAVFTFEEKTVCDKFDYFLVAFIEG